MCPGLLSIDSFQLCIQVQFQACRRENHTARRNRFNQSWTQGKVSEGGDFTVKGETWQHCEGKIHFLIFCFFSGTYLWKSIKILIYCMFIIFMLYFWENLYVHPCFFEILLLSGIRFQFPSLRDWKLTLRKWTCFKKCLSSF